MRSGYKDKLLEDLRAGVASEDDLKALVGYVIPKKKDINKVRLSKLRIDLSSLD